ncbi:hypothetical protein KI387_001409 [Taxus chinensis]|uniref:Uncharacterized protein n=1 Tax=Taxus chinensis TaxID=29808 RepID=A0AA38LMM4_TAXCH|nr:hypothetical protein KI387_001409 [Taxus chinensis]
MVTTSASQAQYKIQEENPVNPNAQTTGKILYRNPLCPHIQTVLKMNSEYKDLIDACEFGGLVRMPHFETDTDILNYLISSYNTEDDLFYVTVDDGRMFQFGIDPTDIHRFTGLPFKNLPFVTSKATLVEDDKKYLESNFGFHVDCKYNCFHSSFCIQFLI